MIMMAVTMMIMMIMIIITKYHHNHQSHHNHYNHNDNHNHHNHHHNHQNHHHNHHDIGWLQHSDDNNYSETLTYQIQLRIETFIQVKIIGWKFLLNFNRFQLQIKNQFRFPKTERMTAT